MCDAKTTSYCDCGYYGVPLNPRPKSLPNCILMQFASTADAETTRADTDAGAEESHHPATASTLGKTPKSPPGVDAQTHVPPSGPSVEPRAEGSQPTAESAQQQIPVLSTSQRLWNAAQDIAKPTRDNTEA